MSVFNPYKKQMLRRRKSSHELARSQVSTPQNIIKIFWDILHSHRSKMSTVLDLGAGDGRFSEYGNYSRYVGVEIDSSRIAKNKQASKISILNKCAFEIDHADFDACIGNPPYVRHHDLEPEWRDSIAAMLQDATSSGVNRHCNLYIYFMFLAIFKTAVDGVVAQLIPYEWVSRPAAKPLREYIDRQGWDVHVYKFTQSIFDDVLTTACITVVDKKQRNKRWSYYNVTPEGVVSKTKNSTGTRRRVLKYEDRGAIWAQRGMSPGTQKVFTLTEGERIHNGLKRSDVMPCITTMRQLPPKVSLLDKNTFYENYVNQGLRCWLIRSQSDSISDQLMCYLDSIPPAARATATCLQQDPWYRYPLFDIPKCVASTAFVGKTTKVMINDYKVRAIGTVCGIFHGSEYVAQEVRDAIASVNFESQIIPHARKLKKIEIRQFNSILNRIAEGKAVDG